MKIVCNWHIPPLLMFEREPLDDTRTIETICYECYKEMMAGNGIKAAGIPEELGNCEITRVEAMGDIHVLCNDHFYKITIGGDVLEEDAPEGLGTNNFPEDEEETKEEIARRVIARLEVIDKERDELSNRRKRRNGPQPLLPVGVKAKYFEKGQVPHVENTPTALAKYLQIKPAKFVLGRHEWDGIKYGTEGYRTTTHAFTANGYVVDIGDGWNVLKNVNKKPYTKFEARKSDNK